MRVSYTEFYYYCCLFLVRDAHPTHRWSLSLFTTCIQAIYIQWSLYKILCMSVLQVRLCASLKISYFFPKKWVHNNSNHPYLVVSRVHICFRGDNKDGYHQQCLTFIYLQRTHINGYTHTRLAFWGVLHTHDTLMVVVCVCFNCWNMNWNKNVFYKKKINVSWTLFI